MDPTFSHRYLGPRHFVPLIAGRSTRGAGTPQILQRNKSLVALVLSEKVPRLRQSTDLVRLYPCENDNIAAPTRLQATNSIVPGLFSGWQRQILNAARLDNAPLSWPRHAVEMSVLRPPSVSEVLAKFFTSPAVSELSDELQDEVPTESSPQANRTVGLPTPQTVMPLYMINSAWFPCSTMPLDSRCADRTIGS